MRRQLFLLLDIVAPGLRRLALLTAAQRVLPLTLCGIALSLAFAAACGPAGVEDAARAGNSPPPATVRPAPSPTTTALPTVAPTTAPAPTAEPTAAPPTPVPYATPDLTQLPYDTLFNEVLLGDTNVPAVALTLDGGSIATYTAEILAILRQHDVRLTIFLTGQFVERNPDLVKEMVADGHEIGNHSYGHPYFTEIDDDAIRAELARTEEIIQQVAGVGTKPWFRAPYGDRDAHVLDVVAREGYRSVYWSIDTIDWREDATPDLVKQRIRDGLQNGAIILAHLGSPQTLEALPDILTELAEGGYRIVTVSELLYPPPDPTPSPQPPAGGALAPAAATRTSHTLDSVTGLP